MTEHDIDTEPAPPLSLGERCVAWCRAEMARQLAPSQSTLERFFARVERERAPGLSGYLVAECRRGQRPNHCAAAQSTALLECSRDDEPWPHRPRAAAKELMADAVRTGTWRPKGACAQGWRPKPGDLAIYDRSKPGKPETSWMGHVDRVIAAHEHEYDNIGANEGPGGAWRVETTRYDHPKLLGFIEYPADVVPEPLPPDTPGAPEDPITDELREHLQSLMLLTLDAEARHWERGSAGEERFS